MRLLIFILCCLCLHANEARSKNILTTYNGKSISIEIPEFCKIYNDNIDYGDIKLFCNNVELFIQAMPIEIGCYENARIFADLLGDEPRGLKVQDLSTEYNLSTNNTYEILYFDVTPAGKLSSLPFVIVCKNETSVGIFSEDKNLVHSVAKSLKF